MVLHDVPLLLKNGSVFVPFRFVAEQLNTSVEYMGSMKMVIKLTGNDSAIKQESS
ncbi:stalk domain-containing protein [Paenibacillus illinoisensis]|uniref:stalk domain-containing protein n=1 Tax=Paenibacillus illinoisensis TaxID=59845 RepID=UPI003C6E2660